MTLYQRIRIAEQKAAEEKAASLQPLRHPAPSRPEWVRRAQDQDLDHPLPPKVYH